MNRIEQELFGSIPLYSSRIIKGFCEYLEKFYPHVEIRPILDHAGIAAYHLDDEGHWLTQGQVDLFYEKLLNITGDPHLARKVGQYLPSSRAAGVLKQFCLGFMTPAATYKMLEILHSHVSRGASVQTKNLGLSRMEVVATPNPGVMEKPYQCENRLGILESVPTLFTNKMAHIEHETCIHKGDDRCLYKISWEETPSCRWKRISHIAIPAGGIVGFLLLYFLPGNIGLISFFSLILAVLALFFYQAYQKNKELEQAFHSQRVLANDLLEEINNRYNNSLLFQEISEASTNIVDIKRLMDFSLSAIKKHLHFERGLIMCANEEGTRLVYYAGYGHSPDDENFLRGLQFHLDKPDSKGPFVMAFKHQRPFLINQLQNIFQDISEKSREFTEHFHVESFICVPIMYEGVSLGILAVDNHSLKRPLNQSDVNILFAIASQIGISINNARSYNKIRESEERFRALSENAPDIIYTTDTNGMISYVNPAWERLLGHLRADVIGKNFFHFTRDYSEHFTTLFAEICNKRSNFEGQEVIFLHKDGSQRIFLMSGAPNVNTAGEVTGIVGTLRDITKQRQLEGQLLQASKMQAIGTLTGGIAHDFNNIMQGIRGYNQLLMMGKDEFHPDWRYYNNIEQLTKRAADLVKKLLIFSRKAENNMGPVDLNKEIREYYNLLKETIPKTISLDLALAADLWKITGDPGQLGQVIMNLAVNAKDAMPEGGGLRIETGNVVISKREVIDGVELNPGRFVRLSVSDTGQGMSPEVLAHIYEPFYSTKEPGQGTGLGLAVVHGIVTNHNGHIACISDPAKGTTFHIYLPASDSPGQDENVQPEDTLKKVESSPSSETVLIVDDEESLLDTNKTLLELHGYQVLTADSGVKAIDLYSQEKTIISLVILDLQMPGMDGIKCLELLKGIDPRVKVIIASGYITTEKQEEIIDKGAIGFIQKPYHFQDMLNMIHRVLDKEAP